MWVCFSSVEELYPGRLYGTLDSGFNSVDSGDKRWSGNEVRHTFFSRSRLSDIQKILCCPGSGLGTNSWMIILPTVTCGRVTDTFEKCGKTMFQEPLQQFFLISFLFVFSYPVHCEQSIWPGWLNLADRQWGIVNDFWFFWVLILWQYGLADVCHFQLELLFFSRALFTLPENCMLMLVVLALWKDDCGILSRVQGPLNQPGKLAGQRGLLAI